LTAIIYTSHAGRTSAVRGIAAARRHATYTTGTNARIDAILPRTMFVGAFVFFDDIAANYFITYAKMPRFGHTARVPTAMSRTLLTL